MAVREIRSADFDQECARCGAVRAVSLSSVEVGVARDNQIDTRVVPLPPCPTCGATEFLIRSPADEEYPAPGSYGHLHRILVDELHARLVKANQVAKGLDSKTVEVKQPAAEMLGRYFPDGLKLSPPSKENKGGK